MRLTVENTAKDFQPVVASGASHRLFPGEKLEADFTTAEVDEARKNPALRFNDDQLKLSGYLDTDARKIDPPKPNAAPAGKTKPAAPAGKAKPADHAHGTRSRSAAGR